MLGFGKKKKTKSKKNQNEQATVDPKVTEQIHTMPERFYVKPVRKRSGGLTLIILLGVLVVAILAAAAIYFSLSLSSDSQPAQQPTQPETQQPAIPEVQDPVKEVEEGLSNLTSTTTEFEIEDPEDSTTTEEIIEPDPEKLSSDQDSDGLTLAEERLYNSDPLLSDTDEDGYDDGSEVINGYNPTEAGTTLEQAGLFRRYTGTFYTVLYPNSWELRDQDPASAEVFFIADSGEFVEILILQNLNSLTLEDWYKQQFGEVAQAGINMININGSDAILHPNGLTYYLLNQQNPNSIYIITYNQAGLPDLNFISTFQSIANSFRLVE